MAQGNILGDARAEADPMLDKAFVATADYRGLVETDDYNFVVGRRGTGKSALFRKVSEHFRSDPKTLLIAEKPQEHDIFALHERLERLNGTYRSIRAICRVAWKIQFFVATLESARNFYKIKNTETQEKIVEYFDQHREFLGAKQGMARCLLIINESLRNLQGYATDSIPGIVATNFDLEQLETLTRKALRETKRRSMIIYDGLDEGWQPSALPTAVLGGLAIAASDLRDNRIGIQCVLFVRDNMFRALAQLDSDFSRHIEGSTIRLHWDENSLLHLVAERLRVALELNAENDERVWNKFALLDLRDREGFNRCLQQTLYRPRDALVLFNRANEIARRGGTSSICAADVDSAAKRISIERLDDLHKEYDKVLPGVKLFTELFRSLPAKGTVGGVLSILDAAFTPEQASLLETGDFALLGSASQVFSVLYSIGFLGVHDQTFGRYIFCHDGANSDVLATPRDVQTVVHPCFWKALEVQGDAQPEEVMVQIHDEYDARSAAVELADLRVKRLGQILGELPNIPLGEEGRAIFEQWSLATCQILFAGKNRLTGIRFSKSNPASGKQIVATNNAQDGLWKKIKDHLGVTRITFSPLNYDEPKMDDLKDRSLGPEQSKFIFMITRSVNEGLSETEREFVQISWVQKKQFLLIVPASLLARCLGKLRAPKRKFDYAEDLLLKRIDIFLRSYIGDRSMPRFRGGH